MNDFLEHYNHNHDALGRFSKSSASTRNRAAKRGLNKLYRLDKKANTHFAKGYKSYFIATKPRRKYHKLRYNAGFPLFKMSTSKKAKKYAKRLQKRIGTEHVPGLNAKQVYVGRSYCLEFVE